MSHGKSPSGGRNAQHDTSWELNRLESNPPEENGGGAPRYRLTVRVASVQPGLEYVWTGNLCLTPRGQCWLEEMVQRRSDNGNANPTRISTAFLVKEIQDPREAMRVVAAACRQASLHGEKGARNQAEEQRKALQEVERILAEGPQTI